MKVCCTNCSLPEHMLKLFNKKMYEISAKNTVEANKICVFACRQYNIFRKVVMAR